MPVIEHDEENVGNTQENTKRSLLSPKNIFIALGLFLLISVFGVYHLIVHTFQLSPIQMNLGSGDYVPSHNSSLVSPLKTFLFFTDLGSIFALDPSDPELKSKLLLLTNWRYNCYFQVSKQQVYFQSETTVKMINLHTLAVDSIELPMQSVYGFALKDPDSIFYIVGTEKGAFSIRHYSLKDRIPIKDYAHKCQGFPKILNQSISGTSKLYYKCIDQNEVYVKDLTSQNEDYISFTLCMYENVFFSPDNSKAIIYGYKRNTLDIVNLSDRALKRVILDKSPYPIISHSFSADQKILYLVKQAEADATRFELFTVDFENLLSNTGSTVVLGPGRPIEITMPKSD